MAVTPRRYVRGRNARLETALRSAEVCSVYEMLTGAPHKICKIVLEIIGSVGTDSRV